MSNNINNDNEQNNLLNLKIDISQTEEDRDNTQSISISNNQINSKFLNIGKKYENEPSLEMNPKKKYNLDNVNLSSLQISNIKKRKKFIEG